MALLFLRKRFLKIYSHIKLCQCKDTSHESVDSNKESLETKVHVPSLSDAVISLMISEICQQQNYSLLLKTDCMPWAYFVDKSFWHLAIHVLAWLKHINLTAFLWFHSTIHQNKLYINMYIFCIKTFLLKNKGFNFS